MAIDTPIEQSPLLDLPTEVRLTILRHLLYSSRPLRRYTTDTDSVDSHPVRQSTFTFFTNILCVNRQLHSEGHPILYSDNALSAELSDRPDDLKLTILDCDHELYTFERGIKPLPFLEGHFNRLAISIQLRHPSLLPNESEQRCTPTLIRGAIQDLITTLNRPSFPAAGKSWSVTISCTITPAPPTIASSTPFNPTPLLSTFKYLRNVQSVTFTDTLPNHVPQLTTQILTNNKPHLYPMFLALLNYTKYWWHPDIRILTVPESTWTRPPSSSSTTATPSFEHLDINLLERLVPGLPQRFMVHLMKHDLEGCIPWLKTPLGWAREAADRDDVEGFMAVRREVLLALDERWRGFREGVYAWDGESVGGGTTKEGK